MADGASHGPPELVLPQNASVGAVKVAGIQVRIAQKLEPAAVQLVGAGLGDHVDLGACVVSVLGVAVVRDDAEFGNRVKVRDDDRSHTG